MTKTLPTKAGVPQKYIKEAGERFEKEFEDMRTIWPDAFDEDIAKFGITPTVNLHNMPDIKVGKSLLKFFLTNELERMWDVAVREMEKIVGEDENNEREIYKNEDVTCTFTIDGSTYRNELRSKLRQKLSELKPSKSMELKRGKKK